MSLNQPNAVRQQPDFERPSDPPPSTVRTRLIEDPREKSIATELRETDAHTALVRGLAEYVGGLEFELRGRPIRFVKVVEDWGDVEEGDEYPRAAVYSNNIGIYSDNAFSPSPSSANRLSVDGEDPAKYLVCTSEYNIDLQLDVWATDATERMALRMMLEDALNPLVYRYGLRLELPHYHNIRGDYESMSVQNLDSDAMVVQRYRVCTFILSAKVPVVRVVSFPFGKVRTEVEVGLPDC